MTNLSESKQEVLEILELIGRGTARDIALVNINTNPEEILDLSKEKDRIRKILYDLDQAKIVRVSGRTRESRMGTSSKIYEIRPA